MEELCPRPATTTAAPTTNTVASTQAPGKKERMKMFWGQGQQNPAGKEAPAKQSAHPDFDLWQS